MRKIDGIGVSPRESLHKLGDRLMVHLPKRLKRGRPVAFRRRAVATTPGLTEVGPASPLRYCGRLGTG